MLFEAMDFFQRAKREHTENVKNQHREANGLDGRKNYFRASELGNDDRKIIYGFFKHQIPHDAPNAHSLRIFENGDYVHERYQKAWQDMGALISMEQRLSSKDDEFLSEYPWEWAGHYDGELDLNILRAHALGFAKVSSEYNEEVGDWEIIVDLDHEYAAKIGIFDAEGNISEDYEPVTMIADIKTMNPFGFDRIYKKADISDIQGYIDQIQFYMYMKNTPYGSIFIENKANNKTLEVQIVWRDLHEDIEYEFEPIIHGNLTSDKIRVVVTSERFFGGDDTEGCVGRLDRLWELKTAIEKADEEGNFETVANLMPARCSDKPDGFPCSWSSGQCDFYEHCWGASEGLSVRAFEAVPQEFVWEFEDGGAVVRVDSRKVPEGITYEGFIGLVNMNALRLDDFIITDQVPDLKTLLPDESVKDTALTADNLFTSTGELDLSLGLSGSDVPKPTEAQEYKTEDDENAVDCLNCGKQITYVRLGNGGTKKCPHCKHVNRVIKIQA